MELNKEDIKKELDQIQNCISRMATNSFYIKGWHITLLSVLVSFLISREQTNYIILFSFILFVTFVMSNLDAYYLLLERKYRWKYEWVIENRFNSENTNNSFYLNLNPNETSMWILNDNNPEMKAAQMSINNKNKSWIKKLRCHRKEIKLAMRSGVMQIQYLIISIVSIIGLTTSIIIHFI